MAHFNLGARVSTPRFTPEATNQFEFYSLWIKSITARLN